MYSLIFLPYHRFGQFLEREPCKPVVEFNFRKSLPDRFGCVFHAFQHIFHFGEVAVVAKKTAVKANLTDE